MNKLNQRLKRKLQKNKQKGFSSDEELDNPCDTAEAILIGSVSPASKKRAKRRLKLSKTIIGPAKNELRVNRTRISALGRKSRFEKQVKDFMLRDENSIIIPNIKKEKNYAIDYSLLRIYILNLI